MNIDEMRDKYRALIDEARSIEERDELTDEDKTEIEGLLDGADEVRRDIEREERLSSSQDWGKEKVTPEIRVRDRGEDKPWSGFGEFLGAVVRSALPGNSPDPRLIETRQLGLNEGVPSEGGFLVQTDHVAELLKRTYETGALTGRVRRIPVSANANGLTINAVAETSRATGSRWGGIQAYWLQEAGTKTPTNPEFRQMELKLKKLIGLCYATDELLQDTAALENIIQQAFTEEFGFMLDEAIFRGTGVGQPLGILNSPSLVTVDAEPGQAADTVLYENIVNMWSRAWGRGRANSVWLINQDIEPQLHTMSLAVGVGGVPVYMPAGGASASPYGTLFGRPVIPIEQASTLGTAGDIVLADLSQYLTIDKGGIQQASSIHVQFLTDQTAFRFVYRVDGQPVWNAPLTPAQGTNALSPFVALEAR